jgi:hypothetical protein
VSQYIGPSGNVSRFSSRASGRIIEQYGVENGRYEEPMKLGLRPVAGVLHTYSAQIDATRWAAVAYLNAPRAVFSRA